MDLMHQRYTDRLRQYTEQYKHVVMIGDSMGASAALLFSPLATKVMSFCPQVCSCLLSHVLYCVPFTCLRHTVLEAHPARFLRGVLQHCSTAVSAHPTFKSLPAQAANT